MLNISLQLLYIYIYVCNKYLLQTSLSLFSPLSLHLAVHLEVIRGLRQPYAFPIIALELI